MPDNHRGMPLNGNHRPTPRLAQLLARQMSTSAFKSPFSSEYAQSELDHYRYARDEHAKDVSTGYLSEEEANERTAPERNAINKAIRNR
jgi:hypothetical protein